ncbi:MAG: hypothetical protein AAFN40_16910 [Cyanobacteria bacterium J06560_6]
MKRLTFAGFFLSILAIAPPSFAQTINTAQESPQTTVSLYLGQGVTLNFRPTGETIQRAWLDDPSRTTLDFDDASCTTTDTEGCAASVIHLRRINPIDFPGLPAANITSLTVLTNSGLYSFRLTFPDTGSPSYSVLNIEPERENISPASPQPIASQMTQAEGLTAIEQGLNAALDDGLIAQDDSLWQRTQTFLSLVREGLPAQAAARQAGISRELILRLVEMGAQNQNLAI